MEKITNIEELIADAKAEEEVRREQAKEELTNTLTKSFTDAFKAKMGATVNVDVTEYVYLKQIEADYNRIMGAIERSFGPNYDNTKARIDDGDIILDVYKALYPAEFEEIQERIVKHVAENDG